MEQRKTEEKQELTPQMLGLYYGGRAQVEGLREMLINSHFINSVVEWNDFDKVKVCLRPLSDITEEEKTEAELDYIQLKMIENNWSLLDLRWNYKQFAHLLSRGFDLGIIPQQYVIHKTNSK